MPEFAVDTFLASQSTDFMVAARELSTRDPVSYLVGSPGDGATDTDSWQSFATATATRAVAESIARQIATRMTSMKSH